MSGGNRTSRGKPGKEINEGTKISLGIGLAILGMTNAATAYITSSRAEAHSDRELAKLESSCSTETTPVTINFLTSSTSTIQEAPGEVSQIPRTQMQSKVRKKSGEN